MSARRFRPRLLVESLATVAICELLIMLVLPILLPGANSWVEAAADTTMLSLSAGPLLYWRFNRHHKIQTAILEAEVRQRTSDLDRINRELETQKLALDEHAIVAVTDARGRITYANDWFCKVSGYSRSEMEGQDHRILKSGVHSRAFYADLWKTIGGGKVWHGEFCNKSKDGSLYWVDSTIVPLLGGDGKPKGYISIRTDITAIKRVEEAMRASEHRYRQVIESLDVPIYTCDAQGRITLFNSAAVRIWGRKPEWHKDSWCGSWRLFDPGGEPIAHEQSPMAETIRSGRPVSGRGMVVERPDGTRAHLLACPSPIRDTGGELIGAVNLLIDITESRRIQAELTAAKEAAEAATRAKSDFLATMSHEIRTPMNGVLGFTDLLRETPLDAEQSNFIEFIKSSGEALLSVIDDILDFSKIESGSMNLEVRECDLFRIVSQVLALTSTRSRDKGVEVRLDCPKDLPCRLATDECRVRQVLFNLIGNALKFTEQGSVTVRLSEVNEGELRYLQIEIIDTGIGISDEQQQRLFQRFTQADSSTTRRFGGTGLGLAISRRLIELMGGTIGLRSEPGKGSNFWFRLPASIQGATACTEDLAPEAAGRPAATPAISGPLGAVRILVAEDIRMNQLLVKHVLERFGCQPHFSDNGVAAVECFRKNPYDLVLMDCHMPVLDGFAATREIRNLEQNLRPDAPRTPIFALTASVTADDQKRCLDAGMDGVLTKPIQIDEFQKLLERISVRAAA